MPSEGRCPGWRGEAGAGSTGGSHHGRGKAASALLNPAKGHPQRPLRAEILFTANHLVKGVRSQRELTEQRHRSVLLQPQVKPSHRFWDIPEQAQISPGISHASGNGNGSELMLIIKFYGFSIKCASQLLLSTNLHHDCDLYRVLP